MGRARGQRWSSQSTCDGSASRIEAVLHAEFRVLHAEIAELREIIAARTPAPRAPRATGGRRTLGRGLDQLMNTGSGDWSESLIPESDPGDETP